MHVLRLKTHVLRQKIRFKAKNVHLKAKNVCFKAKNMCYSFVNNFVKFWKNFAKTKLLISFDNFHNFETGCVSYFEKYETTKRSTFCRALLFSHNLDFDNETNDKISLLHKWTNVIHK